jgi:hypothetical protein
MPSYDELGWEAASLMHADGTDAGDHGDTDAGDAGVGEFGPARGETQDLVDSLRRLAVLRDRDVLNEHEYRLAKEKLVAEDTSAPDDSS